MSERHLQDAVERLLWVAAGAVPGALLRWHWSDGWHGTLAANLLAALMLGSLVPLQKRHPRLLLMLGVGFCGSLSTFSTWMLELVDALQSAESGQALIVLLTNLLGGLVAVGLGSTVSQRWIRRQERRRSTRPADHRRSSE
jgi:CrcB protein